MVQRSRATSLRSLGGCLVLVAACLLLLTTGHPVALVIAVLGIVTFGTFGALWVRQLLRPGPALVVDDDGFDDRSSATAVGRVPWTDVARVTTWTMSGTTCVAVHVRNPDEHLARLGWFSRRAGRANVGLVGTPVVLAAGGMQRDTESLLAVLRQGFERHLARSPRGFSS